MKEMGTLSPKSIVIAYYALAIFNFSSMPVQLEHHSYSAS